MQEANKKLFETSRTENQKLQAAKFPKIEK